MIYFFDIYYYFFIIFDNIILFSLIIISFRSSLYNDSTNDNSQCHFENIKSILSKHNNIKSL